MIKFILKIGRLINFSFNFACLIVVFYFKQKKYIKEMKEDEKDTIKLLKKRHEK